MELETPVLPGEETQIPTPAIDPKPPEVVEPEPTEQTDEPEKSEADPRDKAVKSLTRRVDRITAARYQAEARAQEAERRAQEAMQRLAQYEQPEAQTEKAPDPIALAKEIARIEKITERANAVAKEGRSKFQNFDAAVQTVNRDAGPLFDQFGRATPLGEAILSADEPSAVLHALGSDPDLAAELADLTPIQQARRIARLEIELGKPKEPPQSKAPKPISPVKAATADTGLSDNLPIDEWRRRFLADRAKRK